jgi:parvulin-like peptidyl-prolyl isomerase
MGALNRRYSFPVAGPRPGAFLDQMPQAARAPRAEDPTARRRRVGVILVAIVAALALAAVLSSAGGVESGDVADVKKAGSVSQQDFDHWLTVVASQPQPGQKKPAQPPKPGSRQYDAVKQQVMQFLVSAKWIEGEAKDRGLSATDAEVKRQFDQTKDQSFPNEKAYKRFLKTSGQTEQDLLFRVKLDVLSNKIRQQVTEQSQKVSDSEIEDYYNKNQQQFSQPERRDLEVILTKNQAKALEAKKAVDRRQKWSAAAKKYSVDPASKEQGGKLLGVSKGQQDPKFDAAIFAAVQGRVAGPVKTDAGYYVFRVTKVTKATKQGLEQSKQGIRQLLVSQKQQKDLDQFSTNFRNTWRKRTDCADDFVIPDCRNGREPAQAATPAVPPGQPKPLPGSSGANPPALDGTGTNLSGGNGVGTVIGNPPPAAGGAAGGGLGGLGATPGANAPLALGGAPKKGAAAAPGGLPPGSVPGATPGAGGQVPPQQGQAAPQGGG